MTMMLLCSLLGVSIDAAAGPTAPAAPTTPAKPMDPREAKVRKLLELTGAAALGQQTLDAMLMEFSSMPGLPPGFIEEIRALAKAEQLVDLIVPVYLQHLQEADIDAAIAFYSSPSGKRMVSALPAINQQSMAAGQQWGAQLAEQAMKNLMAKQQAPAPAPKK
jgi:hypothetical protein